MSSTDVEAPSFGKRPEAPLTLSHGVEFDCKRAFSSFLADLSAEASAKEEATFAPANSFIGASNSGSLGSLTHSSV